MTSETERSVRDEMLHAAVGLLDDQGPDALQTRRVAGAAGTSTMAVYTHFGGMRGLIAEVAEEGTSLTLANDLAIRRALEGAGVVFIDENGGGVGVRLRARRKGKSQRK